MSGQEIEEMAFVLLRLGDVDIENVGGSWCMRITKKENEQE